MNRIRYLFVGAVMLHLLSLFFDSDSSFQLAIAPEIVGAGIAAGGSLINGLFGNSLGRSNARYQANLQKELMNYQWNNYNSPSAQAKALADAGMNPSVVFGQGSNFSSPSASAPSVSPVDIGLSGADLSQSILALSQAKKVGAETIGQNIENEVNSKVINERIKSFAKQNNLTDEQANLLMRQASQIEGQNSKLQEEINNLRKEGVKMDFENEHLKDFFNAAMRQYADRHNIDAQTLKQMQEQAPIILNKLKAEERILNIDAEIAENFKSTQANLGVLGQVLGFIGQFVKMLK